MISPEVIAYGSLAVSVLAFLKVFFFLTVQLASLQVKVDTMWEFTLRRGAAEAVIHGAATLNSPFCMTAKGYAIIQRMEMELHEFYKTLDLKINDAELILKIEQKFGDKITRDVCIPNQIFFGACLILAAQVAKGNGGVINI